MPKIELHLHLDCSLSFQVVEMLRPEISAKEYGEAFIAPPKCRDLADYISRAAGSIELMQTEHALRAVTLDLFDQLAADNVIYAEIRFAPLEHLREGLTPERVVEAVTDAAKEGARSAGLVDAGIILCTLRHYTEVQSMDTVRLVEQYRDRGVAGFDIAGDEAGFPIDNHIPAFDYANEQGLNITAHAGEARGAESVWETLEYFHPVRLGHGVRCVDDPELIRHLRENEIHLEVCPTSNIQTDAFDTISNHSIDPMFRSGLSVGINTDARTISNVTLEQEYRTLRDTFDWDLDHFKRCNLAAAEHAFAPAETKNRLRKTIRQGYEKGR